MATSSQWMLQLNRVRGWTIRHYKQLSPRSRALLLVNTLLLLYTCFGRSSRPSYTAVLSNNNNDQVLDEPGFADAYSPVPEQHSSLRSDESKTEGNEDDLSQLVRVLKLQDSNEFFGLFSDADEYLSAANVRVLPHTKVDYKNRWGRLYAHVQYYKNNIHKRYVPRLQKQLTPEKFIKTFMMTSTPVIIPADMLSHLDYKVPAYESLDQLASAFPDVADPETFPGYIWSGLQKSMLNLKPAVRHLKDHNLDTSGKSAEDETCYKKGVSKFCYYPRNTKLDAKHLKNLGITKPPPLLVERAFQVPSIWMAPPKHHTSNHHDASDNFILHLLGVKRWTLFPPVDSKYMYKQCIHKGLCKARIKHPDDPQSAEAKDIVANIANPIVVDLLPGEILYLPNGWFHHVEAVDGTTTLIANFWTKLDYHANGGLQRGLQNQTWEEIYNGIYTIDVQGNRRIVVKE